MSTVETDLPSNDNQGVKRRRDDDGQQYYKRQKPRNVYSPLPRLRKLLTCLGEPSAFDPVDSIRHCGNALAEHILEDDIVEELLQIIYFITIEQPLKTFPLAVAIQVANSHQSTIGSKVLTHFANRGQEAIDLGDWNTVKLVVRFLIMLLPMISNSEAVPEFLEQLLARSLDLRGKSKAETRLAEEIYGVVLFSLPYLVLSDSSDEMKQKVASLFDKSKEFGYVPPRAEELISPFVDAETPYKVYDVLELLQTQLESTITANWDLKFLRDSREVLPVDFESHSLAQLVLPTDLITTRPTRTPELYLRFFLSSQVDTTVPTDLIESSLLRDLLTDTITNLDFNRLEVARQLTWFDSFLRPGLLAPREMSLERLSQSQTGSTWKPEDIAVEAVLACMFRLPKPEHKPVYFHSVLIEACILAPHAIAPVFGRAVRFLYSQLEHLDVQIIYQYTDWLAHHLSNFGYTWKWKEWSADLELDELHPKRVFIRELILKELRLSFPQRIKETLPDEFMQFVYDGEDIPPFKMVAPDQPFAEQGRVIVQNIRDRKEIHEFDSVFEEIRTRCAEEGGADGDSVIREIFVTAVLHSGARSLSHVDSWIERCLPHLLKLVPKEDSKSQREVATYVFNFWEDQTGTAVQIVKKLMTYGVITPLSVAEWLLIDSEVDSLSRGHSWELLGFTVDRAKLLISDAERQVRSESDEDFENKEVETLKSALNHIFVTIVRELSRPIVGDGKSEETVRWQRWWKDGFLRAFLRKYHEDFKELQEPLKNLGLTDTFILNSIEQAAEL